MPNLKMLLDPTRVGTEAETLEESLHKKVVGQDNAIRQITDIYQTFVSGMSSPGRPVGSLLFLGPTGTGKTRTVEAVAEALVGDAHAVIKIDCAEFQHSHEIAKLIGSPPGYLGHRETHPLLSQEVLSQHHTDTVKLSFVLFDEIEKASDALWNLLLGILDKGILTLGDNRRVDFSRALIFMTSNLGAAEMNSIMRPGLGFRSARPDGEALDEQTAGRVSRAGVEAARRKFTPEFLNRIDRIVVFNTLSSAELRRIVDIELAVVEERVCRATGSAAINFHVDNAAKDFLLKEGTDARYGARHLKRAIERNLVQPMSNLIATGQLQNADQVIVEFDSARARLIFSKEFREPAEQVAVEKSAAA